MKSKYKSHLEWKKASPQDWSSAQCRGLLPEICEAMGWPLPKTRNINPPGYWKDKETVLTDSKKYTSRSVWAKKSIFE